MEAHRIRHIIKETKTSKKWLKDKRLEKFMIETLLQSIYEVVTNDDGTKLSKDETIVYLIDRMPNLAKRVV